KNRENHEVIVPYLPRHENQSQLGSEIRFKKAEPNSIANTQKSYSFTINTRRFIFSYSSFKSVLPQAHERLTLVLAGRGLDAYYPQESEGGRVVLILAPGQESLIEPLLAHQVDVLLIKSFKFQGAAVSDADAGSVTARRMAAFELVQGLPGPR